MQVYSRPFVVRDDHIPGYLYLIEAIGFHGIFPGCYLKRCKIGITRNIDMRMNNFLDNQPPCDFRLVRYIFVEDMAGIEKQLHEQFKSRNVKLVKSREWFDFSPVDLAAVHLAFIKYDASDLVKHNRSLVSLAVAGAIALSILGLVIGYSSQKLIDNVPAIQQQKEPVK